ncbi:Uncharacterised protein [Streptococcus equi subsp. zooepidemicus]|nr:Uncharacterised protein [Streptococcus equi subsp. zooepidemicus]
MILPCRNMTLFQSTRPYGARHELWCSIFFAILFQSTRPYGARQASKVSSKIVIVFQSTRPYGARRFVDSMFDNAEKISIHSPVWGETRTSKFFAKCLLFQSTRPYGARLIVSGSKSLRCYFNPLARMGRDQFVANITNHNRRFQSTRPYGARQEYAR